MIVNCPQCETRLQLDAAKTPSEPFKVRCPKCQSPVSVHPATSEASVTETPRANPAESASPYQPTVSAPLFTSESRDGDESSANSSGAVSDLAKILGEALRNAGAGPTLKKGSVTRPSWDRRKALVCSSPAYRQTIAGLLADTDYDVYVADNIAQALGRMREDRMDVIVLDANFDPVEQGVAFVTREIKLMRPLERRRLFVVYLSSSVRTMDLHAAFLHNVNLVVNPSDVEQLPDALEVSLRHYNELYRDFNLALEVAPI